MINNHFKNFDSYNPELLNIKIINSDDHEFYDCKCYIMSNIDGIEEVQIFYDGADITYYFQGMAGSQNFTEGGSFGLSFLPISFEDGKAIELCYEYVRKWFKEKSIYDLYDKENYIDCFESGTDYYFGFIENTIKKNIFTICTFDDSQILDGFSFKKCYKMF